MPAPRAQPVTFASQRLQIELTQGAPRHQVRPRGRTETLAGWGRVGVPGREVRSENLERLTRDQVLTRGLGRSYGDSSLPPPDRPTVAASPLADRMLAFDADTGTLHAEAGLALADINRTFLPRGFFGPITPGTQQITLGGMVAADVHGKNHHVAGCFGEHVTRLRLRVASGDVVECGPDVREDLFRATVGGMGLTGHILEVECRLERVSSAWMWTETERIADIDQFVAALKESAASWPHTMGWIDCLARGSRLGRGILARGRWATPSEARDRMPGRLKRPSFPFELPSWVVDRWSVRLFNELLYRSHIPRVWRRVRHPEEFFFPLDAIANWNRMYGPRGFTQYQCVLPDSAGLGAPRRFLEVLTARGGASMLCVIKDCGPEGTGMLSFPTRGISIALDIPLRDDTQNLVDTLNEQVLKEGGRIYLAKDLLTRPEHYRAMDPRVADWMRTRLAWDPDRRLRSAQSVRLFGDPA